MHNPNSEISANLPWYIAQLKPNGFVTAKLNLQKQNFRTFMPMRQREVRHARKVKTVTRPLFPGYIFVSFDPEITQWRAIDSTFGVSRLITLGTNAPESVPSNIIQSLQSRCDADSLILPPNILEPGNTVRVVDGPFKDIIAEVESLSESGRIAVLLDLMGRAARVEFAPTDLEIAVI